MRLFSYIFICAAIALTFNQAHADQCSYVTKEYAQKTMNLLNDSLASETKIVSWCAPCGETKADAKLKTPESIQTVQIAYTGYQDFYEITINGKSVDMAYTYVAGINLATYINTQAGLTTETAGTACNLSGVSPEL